MDKIDLLQPVFSFYKKVYNRLSDYHGRILFKGTKLGQRGNHCLICYPSFITNPSMVYMGDYARINAYNVVLNNKGRFVMGKYSVASTGLNVVPDGHVSTVGIPHCCLGASHIHDKVEDVIVDEDVWIGMNVTLLSGAHLGRGSVVGANSLITKRSITPPLCGCGRQPSKNHSCKIQYRANFAA